MSKRTWGVALALSFLSTSGVARADGPDLSAFAVYARSGVALRENASVVGGAVGVHDTGVGDSVVAGKRLWLGAGANVEAFQRIYGDSVQLCAGASAGTIGATTFVADPSSHHGQVGPLPPMPDLAPAAIRVPIDPPVVLAPHATTTLSSGTMGTSSSALTRRSSCRADRT